MAKWRRAVGMACLAALPGAMPTAGAFGLGHVKVHSTLGQPLRADIDITQITPDEAGSLKVGLASASAYQARSLNYNLALDGVTVTVEHGAGGRTYLQLVGSRPVHEPYLDLLLRANWSTGELTRSYTLLLDPPGFQEPQALAPVAPQTFAPRPVESREQPSAAGAAASADGMHAGAPAGGSPSTYRVRHGDTLFSVARRLAPAAVSLDQMLAALYRANAQAFEHGNINRLRAGSLLHVPSAHQAAGIAPEQARELIVAQSRDFDAYRRRLAELGPTSAPAQDARRVRGKIHAEVQEPAGAASQPDAQLKLSKAGVASSQNADANWIAAQKQAQALAAKLAQARADLDALAKLAANASAAARAMAPQAAPPQVASASAAVSPSAARPASSPASAPVASAPASKPAAVAKPAQHRPVTPHPAAAAEGGAGSWLAGLGSNPWLAPGGAVIGLLLAGWALLRRRKASRHDANSVFDSHMSGADSFFGGSGGERVDTRNSTLGSSVAYAPSQLDGADVDPVAEADVYLAYGRDLQAEEILKEALKTQPQRNAARVKLLEIYAKRRDARSFELAAAELFARTQGEGAEWKAAQELGRTLDPTNSLYHNTVMPGAGAPSTIAASEFPPSQMPEASATAASGPPTELLAGLPPVQHGEDDETSGLDLSLDLAPAASSAAMAPAQPEPAQPEHLGLDFDLSALGTTPSPAAPAASANAPLEFDLGDLGLHPQAAPSAPETAAEDEAGADTRLALAKECMDIGDVDTARNLLGEIIAEGEGAVREQATQMLSRLEGR